MGSTIKVYSLLIFNFPGQLLWDLNYHKWGKIRWAKHSQFQPYEVVCGEYFRGTLTSSVYYLNIAKY